MTDPTASDIYAQVSTLVANFNANAAQFSTWQTAGVTGGAANPDGTGTGGPWFPLTDLSGAVRYFRCLAYYLAVAAAAVPSTGGSFTGPITLSGTQLNFSAPMAGADGKNSALQATADGHLHYLLQNDATTSASIAFSVARSGTTPIGFMFYSNTYPATDNAYASGLPSFRWNTIFAATGTINTSDAREKTVRGILTDAELLVAKRCAALVKVYQWNDAVADKGAAKARLHVGVIAQEVRDAFVAEGLDGRRYGIVCYDTWAATPAVAGVKDAEGNVTTPAQAARPAGDRWGVRMAELSLLISAAQEQRLLALEAKAP